MMVKQTLLYGVVAGLLAATPASATLISSAAAPGQLAAGACAGNDGGVGSLNVSCSGGIYSSIAISAAGPPLLNAPDLSATTLTVKTTGLGAGTSTLDINIDSSGFAFAGGPVTAIFTVNNLIGGGVGPFVLTASAPVGTLTHTFTASGSAQDGPTILGAFTNDHAEFQLTFTGNAVQSLDATIEIVGAPEPISLALLGTGLLGLGLVRRSRRVSDATLAG
jgi:hypothetical protein